jgi:imidazoleglycerol-phosphate dehydratase
MNSAINGSMNDSLKEVALYQKPRIASINRKTSETDIQLTLNLDGSGNCNLQCPIGFLSHMMNAFCRHGMFDIEGAMTGDLEVDQHHLVEDLGITLGQAFHSALGNRAGIFRSGFFMYPMDETLAQAAVDFGGRPFLVCNAELSNIPLVSMNKGIASSFQTDTVTDFWQGFVSASLCNLHLDIIRGRSDHHKIEALFKAAARAVREAVAIDSQRRTVIPSTKGIIC